MGGSTPYVIEAAGVSGNRQAPRLEDILQELIDLPQGDELTLVLAMPSRSDSTVGEPLTGTDGMAPASRDVLLRAVDAVLRL